MHLSTEDGEAMNSMLGRDSDVSVGRKEKKLIG